VTSCIASRQTRLFTFAVGVLIGQWSCVGQHSSLGSASCRNPFPQATNRTAALPSLSLPVVSGGTVVLGYIADSATHTALNGALIVLRAIDGGAVDTTTAYSDSAGGFALRIRARGRYQYSVLAQNFGLIRDSIDLGRDAETLRVAMRRGLPLCDVRFGR
jgi:hypothetical protein